MREAGDGDLHVHVDRHKLAENQLIGQGMLQDQNTVTPGLWTPTSGVQWTGTSSGATYASVADIKGG